MRFSIYEHRTGRDERCIFDVQLADALDAVSMREWDCAGVFEVDDEEGADIVLIHASHVPGSPGLPGAPGMEIALGKLDAWCLTADAIQHGNFTDQDSGETAQITRLWPTFPKEG